MERVYTMAEVCKILQLNRKTVYRLLQDGRIEGVMLGGHWRVTKEALERALQPAGHAGRRAEGKV